MYRKDFHFNIGDCKPTLTLDEQLDLMISRGLTVTDRRNAIDIIRRTSYYRLSAYSLSLRKNDEFYEGVSFDNIYELYRCDDAFRKIVFNYASYVEISVLVPFELARLSNKEAAEPSGDYCFGSF